MVSQKIVIVIIYTFPSIQTWHDELPSLQDKDEENNRDAKRLVMLKRASVACFGSVKPCTFLVE